MPQIPPGGGGMPPQGGAPPQGAMIAQVLQRLMQSPAAVQGMRNFMQGAAPGTGIPQMAAASGADPRAMLAAGNVMQGPDQGRMAGAGQGGFSSPSTDGALYAAQEANQGVRGNLPKIPDTGGYTGYGEEMEPMPDPRQTPEGDPAEKMAMDQIDKAGNTFDGNRAPSKGDIERLLAAPTDSMVEAFDQQFGDGAAAKYIGPEKDQEAEEAEGDAYPEK